MQSLLELNNEGVDSLVEGDYSSALQSLTSALRELRATPVPSVAAEEECPTSHHVSSFDFCSVPGLLASSSIPVLDKAVQIKSKDEILSFSDHQVASASIIFNMALLHHAKYALSGETTMLQKAQILYEKADSCLEDCPTPTTDLVLALRLAAINNSAVLQQRQGNLEGAQEAFQYLLVLCRHIQENEMIQELTRSSSDSNGRSPEDHDLMKEIQTNALLGSQSASTKLLMDGMVAPAA